MVVRRQALVILLAGMTVFFTACDRHSERNAKTNLLPASASSASTVRIENNDIRSFISGKSFSPEDRTATTLGTETFTPDGRWIAYFSGFDISLKTGRWAVEQSGPADGSICVQWKNKAGKESSQSCRHAKIVDGILMVSKFEMPDYYYPVKVVVYQGDKF